jgi:hypothetical protein
MSRTQKILIISAFSVVVLTLTTFFIVRKKKKVDKSKNFVIGDSQTPFISKNSSKIKMIGDVGSEANLWKGGQNLKWLKEAVEKHPIKSDVNSIVINIGTNGGFNQNDDVDGLVGAVKTKFPNANLYAVQGSWGWGGNQEITQEQVSKYYEKFSKLGVKVINPAIGSVADPHRNLPIYAEIGKALDNQV